MWNLLATASSVNEPKNGLGFGRTRQGKITKGNSTNGTNGLKYFLLQLNDCMMEKSCLQSWGPMSISHSLTVTRVQLTESFKPVEKLDDEDLLLATP